VLIRLILAIDRQRVDQPSPSVFKPAVLNQCGTGVIACQNQRELEFRLCLTKSVRA
jgi:hypothetical protein